MIVKPEVTKIIQVSNLTSHATQEQIITLFGMIGQIDDYKLFFADHNPITNEPDLNQICYVKYKDCESAQISQHLSSTIFLEKPLNVALYLNDEMPQVLDPNVINEKTQALLTPSPNWPAHVVHKITGSGQTQLIHTIDPKLNSLNLPPYPPLSAIYELPKIEEIRRTIYVGNLNSKITGEALLNFFDSNVGEVKYVRMAGDDSQPTRFAFVEFSSQESIPIALQFNGALLADKPLKINHANNAIVKPNSKPPEIVQKEIERALIKVKEVESLITSVMDGNKEKSPSRKKHRRRSRSSSRSSVSSRSSKNRRNHQHRYRRRSSSGSGRFRHQYNHNRLNTTTTRIQTSRDRVRRQSSRDHDRRSSRYKQHHHHHHHHRSPSPSKSPGRHRGGSDAARKSSTTRTNDIKHDDKQQKDSSSKKTSKESAKHRSSHNKDRRSSITTTNNKKSRESRSRSKQHKRNGNALSTTVSKQPEKPSKTKKEDHHSHTHKSVREVVEEEKKVVRSKAKPKSEKDGGGKHSKTSENKKEVVNHKVDSKVKSKSSAQARAKDSEETRVRSDKSDSTSKKKKKKDKDKENTNLTIVVDDSIYTNKKACLHNLENSPSTPPTSLLPIQSKRDDKHDKSIGKSVTKKTDTKTKSTTNGDSSHDTLIEDDEQHHPRDIMEVVASENLSSSDKEVQSEDDDITSNPESSHTTNPKSLKMSDPDILNKTLMMKLEQIEKELDDGDENPNPKHQDLDIIEVILSPDIND